METSTNEFDAISKKESVKVALKDEKPVAKVVKRKLSTKRSLDPKKKIIKTKLYPCRFCGMIFKCLSLRRTHVRKCKMMKARKDMKELTICINHYYASVVSHLYKVYNAIEAKMIAKFGLEKYENSKFHLLYPSLDYMQRSWHYEKMNMIASSEVIINGSSEVEGKSKAGRKRKAKDDEYM